MRSLRLIPALLTAVFLFSCGGAKMEDLATEAGIANLEKNINSPAPPPAPPMGALEEQKEGSAAGGVDKPITIIERKLIKNGEVYFRTKSLPDTKKNIQSALNMFKGYIAKENAYDYSENPQEELIVRIPSQNFDQFLDLILKGADQVDSKKIDIEDVTEQFVDIEARLKNKKQLEAKYQELLAKANNMDDILMINREMNVIREDIDATEGRLRYLSNQVNYSTLRITYYQNKPKGFGFGAKLGDAVGNGGTGFLWFLIGMVNLWPLWVVGGLIWYFIVWLVRRNRKKRV